MARRAMGVTNNRKMMPCCDQTRQSYAILETKTDSQTLSARNHLTAFAT